MNKKFIPYAKHSIDSSDIEAVANTLQSGFLSQGPKIQEFEKALCDYTGAKFAVATSSGTTALFAAYAAAGLRKKSFITTPLTFPATINAGLWLDAEPLICDTESATGNLDPNQIEQKINGSTKAIVSVDLTGRPVAYDQIRKIADQKNLVFISDASQALGSNFNGKKVGTLADMTTFSFHPTKSITTGEGGAILTDRPDLYEKMLSFRNHGMHKTPDYYQIDAWGMNARITDFQSALGISQLKRIDQFKAKRQELVNQYQEKLAELPFLELPGFPDNGASCWHVYNVRFKDVSSAERWEIVRHLRSSGIGVQVLYPLVTQHPFFKQYSKSDCPNAEKYAAECIALPLFFDLSDTDQKRVIDTLHDLPKKFPHLAKEKIRSSS